MRATELPGTCAMQVIHDVDCLEVDDAYSAKEAAKFDELLKPGHGAGHHNTTYVTASIVTLSDEEPDEFKRARSFLIRKGFKLLGTWQGAHADDTYPYKMHLFGSRSMTLPRKK